MNFNNVFGKYPYIDSERLVLKKIEEENSDDLFRIYSNSNVFKYCGIIPKKNYNTVKKMIGHFERDFNKKLNIKLGIFEKKSGMKLTGIIELMNFKEKVNMCTVGYFLAEEYWGKGIATEALKVLKKYLFAYTEINRIQAEVMPQNKASANVLVKNGFLFEGCIKQGNFWPGKGVVDIDVYGFLREYSKE